MTVLKRGAAPVDEHSGMVDTHQVLSTPEGVWDAMLNQTDLGKNANKYAFLHFLWLCLSLMSYMQVLCAAAVAPHREHELLRPLHALGPCGRAWTVPTEGTRRPGYGFRPR